MSVAPEKLVKKYEFLPKKQQTFVDGCVKHGDHYKAYADAGYSVAGRQWKVNARTLFKELRVVITKRINQKIGTNAILALDVIQEIMQDTDQPGATRLKAAQDYLDRAGHKPLDDVKPLQVSAKQVNDEIERLLGSLQKGLDEAKLIEGTVLESNSVRH